MERVIVNQAAFSNKGVISCIKLKFIGFVFHQETGGRRNLPPSAGFISC
jgi:hypothetical protein